MTPVPASPPITKKRIGLFRWVISFVLLLVLGIVWMMLHSGELRAMEVISASMEPTILVGDRLIVKRVDDRPLTVDEIVVATSPDDDGPDLVKRIAAVPGDTVELRAGIFFRNGSMAPAPNSNLNWHPGAGDFKITLGEDEYFLLGDNRPKSHDSTEFGAVPRSSITSTVIYRYGPYSRAGKVE